MNLKSFQDLEIIPVEILQQGTKSIAKNMQIAVVVDYLKRPTANYSLR